MGWVLKFSWFIELRYHTKNSGQVQRLFLWKPKLLIVSPYIACMNDTNVFVLWEPQVSQVFGR